MLFSLDFFHFVVILKAGSIYLMFPAFIGEFETFLTNPSAGRQKNKTKGESK